MPLSRVRRRTAMRLGSLTSVLLALAVLAVLPLADDPLAMFWGPGFAALFILAMEGILFFAAQGRHPRGAKLLALFALVAAAVIVGVPLVVPQNALYTLSTIVLGVAIGIVALLNAFASPDEDRRGRFEPRRPSDVAPPP